MCVCVSVYPFQVIVFSHQISVDTVHSTPVQNKSDVCFVYKMISVVELLEIRIYSGGKW